MEYLDGETLEDRLRKGPLPQRDALRIGAEIAAAIAAAHAGGVVHRDLKPGNVMLTDEGAKVLDFGLAKGLEAQPLAMDTHSPTRMKPLTEEGSFVGTLYYMAPEQLEGGEADARSDVWALGCVLYEMAAGKRPFQGESQVGLIGSILKDEAPSLEEAGTVGMRLG